MTVTIRLFAILRERAGAGSIELALPEGATVATALEALRREGPLAGVIDRLPVQMAVNREYADGSTPLHASDELALIPPVSGGARAQGEERREGRLRRAVLSAQPLSLDRAVRAVESPAAGALVVFCGMTRDVPALEYEAYAEMAEEQLAQIGRGVAERHGLQALAIEHRLGRVPLSEPSVVIAASAAHRAEAFAGAREAIDLIKELAPIWKREDG
ncbi:MAG TPA: molybdenum cofactor biosynthesis protein MoaE [Solirubrobacteraceae bacterium]|nr:molybdenum cofactor biosynthesis protein MoaE [Solirubrobacteraceae bacterium]